MRYIYPSTPARRLTLAPLSPFLHNQIGPLDTHSRISFSVLILIITIVVVVVVVVVDNVPALCPHISHIYVLDSFLDK